MKKRLKLQIILSFVFLSWAKSSGYAIWNGTEERDTERYSFIVSIQIQDPVSKSWMHWCGGSLIHAQYILTAGHCLADPKGDLYPTNMAQIVATNGQKITAKKFYLHPNFYWQPVPGFSSLAENDLAIIELSEPMQEKNIIKIPTSMDANIYQQGRPVLALGYGWYDRKCDPYNKNSYCTNSYPLLRSASMSILPDSAMKWEDREEYRFSFANPYLYPEFFVGVFSGTQGPAAQDSGSPLLALDGENEYVLIGTFSAAVSSPQDFQPSIYTKIGTQENLDWIDKTTNAVAEP